MGKLATSVAGINAVSLGPCVFTIVAAGDWGGLVTSTIDVGGMGVFWWVAFSLVLHDVSTVSASTVEDIACTSGVSRMYVSQHVPLGFARRANPFRDYPGINPN